MANRFNLKIGTQVDSKGVEQLKKEFQDITKVLNDYKEKTGNLNSGMQEALQTTMNVTRAIEAGFNKDFGTVNIAKFNQVLKQSNTSLSQVQKTFTSMGSTGVQAWSNLSSKILSANKDITSLHSSVSSLDSVFKTAFQWNLGTSLFNGFKQEVRDAYDYVTKLDESLNDIRIVTGKGAEEMAQFAVQANEAAKSLGSSSTLDYTKANLIYAQQGLEGALREERARITTEVANLTKDTTDEVAKNLTAVWNGYKVGTEGVESTVDKLSAVAANTASDLKSLSTAMSQVASVANNAGMDIDTLNASISTVIDVTQGSASKVGNSLKSILARMADLALDPNGTDEFGTKLGDISSKLNKIGINILDDEGKLRDMTDVFDETGKKWGDWNREQRQAFAVGIGGKYQYNTLLSLFDNWDKVLRAREISLNSSGALQQQQDIYMESTKAHLGQLKVASEDVYNTILKANDLNTVTDAITGLIEKVATFEKGLGGGMHSLINFASTISMLFSKQIGTGVANTITKVQQMKTELANDKTAMNLVNVINQKQAELRAASTAGNGEQTMYAQASLNALNKQKDMYAEMYKYRRFLTQEEKQGLLTNQSKVFELEKERTILESQTKVHTEIEGKYQSMITAISTIEQKVQEINMLNSQIENGELTVSQALQREGQIRQEIANTIKNQALLSKTSLMENLEGNYRVLDLKRAEQEANQQIVNLYRQQGMSQKDVELLTQKIAQGRQQELATETQILQKEQQIVLQQKQKVATAQKWVQGLSMAASACSILTNSIQTMADKEATVTQKINTWGSSITQLGGMMTTFGLSTGNLLIGGIGAGVSVLSSVLTPVISNWCEDQTVSIEELEKKISSLAETTDTTLNNINTLEGLKKEYENLSKGVDMFGENVSLTADSYERYQEIVKQVLDMSPDVALGYDSEGKAIFEANGLLERQIDLLKEKLDLQRQEVYTNGAVKKKSEEDFGKYKANQDAYKEAEKAKDKMTKLSEENAVFVGAIKDSLARNVVAIQAEYGLEVDEILEAKSKAYQDLYNKMQDRESTEDIFKYLMTLSPQEVQSISNDLPEATGKVFTQAFNKINDKYNDALINFKYQEGIANQKIADTSYLVGLFQASYSDTYEKIVNIGGEQGKQIFQAYADSLDFNKENKSYTDLARKLDAYSRDIVKVFQVKGLPEQIKQSQSNISMNSQAYYNGIKEILNRNKETFLNEYGEWNTDLIKSVFSLNNIKINDKGEIQSIADDTSDQIKKALGELEDKYKNKGLNLGLFNKIFDRDDLSGNLNDIFDKINWKQLTEGSLSAEEALKRVKEELDFTSQTAQTRGDINAIAEALETLKESEGKKKKFTKDEEEFFTGLESRYDELREIGDRTSVAYINTLRRIREEGQTQLSQGLLEDIKQLENKLSSLDVKINPDEYYQVLDELQDKKIQLDVEINTDIDNSIESAQGLVSAYQEVADVITKDFQISFEQAKQFAADGMGFLLENAKSTGKGMIQLDTDVVANYVLNRKSELDVSKEQKIKELGQEKIVLQKKKEILTNKLTALQGALKAETTSEKAKCLAQAGLYQADYEAYNKEQVAKANTAEDANVEISEDAKRLTQFLGNNAEIQAKNQMQAANDAQSAAGDAVNNTIDYMSQLNLKLREVAENMKAAMTGGNVTNSVGKAGKKTVGTNATSSIKSGDSLERTDNASSIKAEDIKSIQDTISKISDDELNKVINDSINSTKDDISSIDSQIGSIDSAISMLKSTSNELGANIKKYKENMDKYGTTHPTKSQLEGKKKKKKKKKSDAEKEKKKKAAQAKKVEKNEIDVETDIYHDLDIALQKVTDRYKDLERARDKAYGKSYLNIINNEKLNLEKQEALEKLKLESIKSRLKSNRASLTANYGIKFNKSGDIKNYNNEIEKWQKYFNAKMKKDPDNSDLYKKRFEKFKKRMENYETLIYKTKRETEDAIDEIQDKIYEMKLKAFTYKVDVKLDTTKAKQDWLKFCLDMSNTKLELKVKDNIVPTVRNSMNQVKEMLSKNGDISVLKDSINSVINSKTISKADKQELLTKYSKELQDGLLNLNKLENEIRQGYIDAIEEADDKFSEHVKKYDIVNEKLEHSKKLISMLYGEESFSLLDDVYNAQKKNNLGQVDMLTKEVRYWESIGTKFKKGTKEWEAWNNKLIESTENLQKAIESSIENLKEAYENAINSTLDMFTRALSGSNMMDMSYLGEQLEMANKENERYLDTLEAIQGVEAYRAKIQKEIDGTKDLALKQKLSELQEKELANLTSKNKLSQYDLDRAEARYDLLVKTNELEKAKNAKNSMKRVRDSQGNWTFNYVADDDEIASKSEEMRNAQNALYKLDKEKYNQNLNEMYSIYQEWQEKTKALYLDSNLTAEELESRKKDYAEYYGTMINDICKDNIFIRKNLEQSMFDSLSEMYDEDSKKVTKWLSKLTGKSYSSWEDIKNNSTQIMDGMNKGFGTTIQDMINRINGEGGFDDTMKNTYDYLDKANQNYKEGINDLQKVSGEDFSNIRDDISSATEETIKLNNNNKSLITSYEELQSQLDRLFNNFSSYQDKWKSLEDSSMAALRAAEQYLELLGDLDKKENKKTTKKTTPTTTKSTTTKKTTPTPTKDGGLPVKSKDTSSSQGNGKIEKGDQVTLKTTPYYYRSDGTGGKGTQHKGEKLYITNINTSGAYPYHLSLGKTLGNGDLGWVKKNQISGFDTGGSTGDWIGNDGKLAFLHKKELVLNQGETKDFLSAIRELRGLKTFLSSNFLGRVSTQNSTVNQSNMSDGIYVENLTVKADNVDQLTKELKSIAIVARQKR